MSKKKEVMFIPIFTSTTGEPTAIVHLDGKGILSFQRSVANDVPITAVEHARSEQYLLRVYLEKLFRGQACTRLVDGSRKNACRYVDTVSDDESVMQVIAVDIPDMLVPSEFFSVLDSPAPKYVRLAVDAELSVCDPPVQVLDDGYVISTLEHGLMQKAFEHFASAKEEVRTEQPVAAA